MSWRYLTSRVDGDGTQGPPQTGLMLEDVKVTRILSDWTQLDATCQDYQADRLGAGETIVYVVHKDDTSGVESVAAACIVDTITPEDDGQRVQITARGFTSVTDGLPWVGATQSHVNANSGDLFRIIWGHVQSQPGGNLGMTLTPFTTAAWSGTAEQPFVLSVAETTDLGQKMKDLVADGIEYRETHALGDDDVTHVLDVGTTVGESKPALRFVVGHNIVSRIVKDVRAVDLPTDVLIVGGERQDTNNNPLPPFWGVARSTDPVGVRRVARFEDDSVTSDADAQAKAVARLAKYHRRVTSYRFTMRSTPLAPFGGFDVGDTITVEGITTLDGDDDEQVRVSSITYQPDDDTAEVEVIPT